MEQERTIGDGGGPLPDSLCRRLKEAFGDNLCSVVLFGSRARGTARPDSDVDILLVFRDLPKSNLRRHAQVDAAIHSSRAASRGPLISVIPLTADELRDHPRVLLDMVEDSRVLADDGTFERERTSLRRRMEELGSKRVFLDDGTWYWVLRPGLKLGETVTL